MLSFPYSEGAIVPKATPVAPATPEARAPDAEVHDSQDTLPMETMVRESPADGAHDSDEEPLVGGGVMLSSAASSGLSTAMNDPWQIKMYVQGAIMRVDAIRSVSQSWLHMLGDHVYAEPIKQHVNEFIVELTMVLSTLEDAKENNSLESKNVDNMIGGLENCFARMKVDVGPFVDDDEPALPEQVEDSDFDESVLFKKRRRLTGKTVGAQKK